MDSPAVICDTGTGVIKAGFASEKSPSVEVLTLLGRPMLQAKEGLAGMELSDLMVGDAAYRARSNCTLSRPIENGVIQDWDGMEALWDHTFDTLGILPNECRIVQTEAALNPLKNREKMVELMFEKYNFLSVNVSVQAILALSSRGLETGLVVDSGDGVTHLVPVYMDHVEPAWVTRMNIAGRHVTEQLMKLLLNGGRALNSKTDFESVREVKQQHCYVAYDVPTEYRLATETTVLERQCTLPDGRMIRLGEERFMAPEILFTPTLYSTNVADHGLSHLIFETINNTSIDARVALFKSVLLSGGTTSFPGFSSRIEKDLKKLITEANPHGKGAKVYVEDPPERKHMVFRGASLMASEMPSDSAWWVSRAEYQEYGKTCIHRLVKTQLR